MFGPMKKDWTDLEDADQYKMYQQMKQQVKAKRQNEAQP